MNWIRQEKRLAIYIRDGLACAYCSASVEEGTQLSLDHVKPHSKGGSNSETNLVTCCFKCNSSRGNRALRTFCKVVAEYVDAEASEIEKHVRNCCRRSIKEAKAEAKEMIDRRGSAAKALSHYS